MKSSDLKNTTSESAWAGGRGNGWLTTSVVQQITLSKFYCCCIKFYTALKHYPLPKMTLRDPSSGSISIRNKFLLLFCVSPSANCCLKPCITFFIFFYLSHPAEILIRKISSSTLLYNPLLFGSYFTLLLTF